MIKTNIPALIKNLIIVTLTLNSNTTSNIIKNIESMLNNRHSFTLIYAF